MWKGKVLKFHLENDSSTIKQASKQMCILNSVVLGCPGVCWFLVLVKCDYLHPKLPNLMSLKTREYN